MVKNNAHVFAACSIILLIFSLWLLTIDRVQFYPTKFDSTLLDDSQNFVEIKTTRDLITLFNRNQYTPPFNKNNTIPKIFLKSIPSDFKKIKDIHKKKSIFIRFMLPIIIEEQKLLRQQRVIAQLLLKNTAQLKQKDVVDWFNRAKKEYKISSGLNFEQQKSELLSRLDELPLTLILAQAAIESAWGTSRFAIEGNSLFGQWTFNSKNGLIPEKRSEGKSHSVKAFPTLQASVRSYLKNINRNNAYRELRESRAQMRLENKKLNAYILAEGLHRYSQKGKQYVDIIRSILTTSDFKALEKLDH